MYETVVEMNDVYYSYEKRQALENINFTISKGSFTGLIGPNGGGKTTLIKLLLGLQKPDKGTIRLFDTPITAFNNWQWISFVSQKANSFNKGFPATVFEVVQAGLTAQLGYLHFFKRQHKEKVLQAIEMVGMKEYVGQNIGHLSGGQQQRVFIARALVSNPTFLILDEPTVGIDRENVQHFYTILKQLNEQNGITIMIVTHDTEIMESYVTKTLYLNKTMQSYETTQ